MKRLCFLSALMLLSGCDTTEDFAGLWQEQPCQMSPCNQRAQIHLGQYGASLTGIISWYRTREGIDTFNTASYECGCQYIQAGTVDDRSLRFVSLSRRTDCNANSLCNPCGCDDYEIQLELLEDERLLGQIICADDTFHSIELERALGIPKDVCSDELL
jgi:hypothetical protein